MPQENNNGKLLPVAFQRAGWTVSVLHHDMLHLTPNGIRIGNLVPDELDLIWLLGFGPRGSCSDRFQILSLLPDQLFVTPPLTMIRLHAKFALCQGPLSHLFPKTWVSGDKAWLKRKILEGGDWVVKPTAGSYGNKVFKISSDNPNLNVILETLTHSSYCTLQAYLESVKQGEKRILIANGNIIGHYKRASKEKFRTNLTTDAEISECTLTKSELNIVSQVLHHFTELGVGFASIDLVGDYIMEINVANPGGLNTLNTLNRTDSAFLAAQSILQNSLELFVKQP
ncbi:MAG: hypothetical protein KUG75_01855 [Pseudomonadales bacterium]|nr:hypothetical protein [Pseudomonadales bacterium]